MLWPYSKVEDRQKKCEQLIFSMDPTGTETCFYIKDLYENKKLEK